MKKILTFVLSLALLFFIVYSPDFRAKDYDSNLEVHFIDVGQGDSILIKSDGENMLIDGGRRSTSKELLKYLDEQGVEELKYVVGTHPHEDHIGGLISVLENLKVENIMLPNVTSNTIVFEDLLDAIQLENLKITKPIVLDKFKVGSSDITVLAPNSKKYSLTNDYSIVLKLQNGEKSFLFTGDAENKSEIEMLEAHKSVLKADVLKLGHHGSDTSTGAEFLDSVDPEYAIISVGEGNGYRHPDKEVIDRLYEKDITIYRTDLDGSIVFKSDGKNMEINDIKIKFKADNFYEGLKKQVSDIKNIVIAKYLTLKINPENI